MKEKKRKKKSKLTFLGAHSHRMNYYIISRQSFKFQKVAKNGQESRPEDASPDNQDRVFSCPREFFSEILLNQTEIRLYLPFSDRFGSENDKYNLVSVWFNRISKKILFRQSCPRDLASLSASRRTNRGPLWNPSSHHRTMVLRVLIGPPLCREAVVSRTVYRQRNLFEILLNQIEIRLYLPFSNGRVQTDVSVCVLNQSENGKCYLISVWFDRISKIFLCVYVFFSGLYFRRFFAVTFTTWKTCFCAPIFFLLSL